MDRLRPELVVEVTFDHESGGRIRHGTKILRWRDDKPPAECLLGQMSLGRLSGCRGGAESGRAAARLDPPRLAALLAEVRRPGRVAESLLLVARASSSSCVQRAGVASISALGSPTAHPFANRVEPQLSRLHVRDLIPAQRRRNARVRLGRTL